MSLGYKDGEPEAGCVVVTGSASGIGRAVVDRLEAAGYDVLGVDLHPAQSEGRRWVEADISDISQHPTILEAAGAPACLVNCAGVTSLERGDMLDLTPESFDRVMQVNLRGTFFLSQAIARAMLKVPTRRRRSIVSIGSVNAEIVGPERADYCMSKAGLAMMTKLFAARLAASGIAVYEIRPGIIRTPMTAAAVGRYDRLILDGGVPMERWGEPSDIAEAVASLIDGALPYATGIAIDVAGGMQLHRL